MKKSSLLVISILMAVILIAGCNNQDALEPSQVVFEPKKNVSEPSIAITEPKVAISEPETDVSSEPSVFEAIPKDVVKDSLGRWWLRVGIADYRHDDSNMVSIGNKIQDFFDGLNLDTGIIKLTVATADGKGDMNEQMSQIDCFIKEKFDVLIIAVNEPFMADDITEKAKAADIPIVYMWREPSWKSMNAWDKVCYVGLDRRQQSTLQGGIVANLPDHGDIDGDGVVRYVMITGDPENIDAQYRTELPIKVLTYRGIEVEELFKESAHWRQEEAQELTASALEQFGDKIDIIFCNNDAMALGAYQAIAAAGRTVNKDIYLLGIDALDEAVDLIEKDKMTGTVDCNIDVLSETIAEAALNYIEGKSNEKYIWIDFVPIVAQIE